MTEAKVVILDEPTAALSPAEASRLFDLMSRMKSRGVAFIYISHRLDEVALVADTVTVLKDGQHVADHLASDLSTDDMVSLMVGRDIADLFPAREDRDIVGAQPVISVRDLIDPPFVSRASFDVFPGEIVGLYGLEGHGQDEILDCLAGVRTPAYGALTIKGKTRQWRARPGRSEFGLVPPDRKTDGLLLGSSGVQNITLPVLRRASMAGVVTSERENEIAIAAASAAGIRGDISKPVTSLSGGNQQKVLLARWLAAGTEFFLLNQPTRGVDVGAKSEIYDLIHDICRSRGAVALVVSREITELQGLCDRILVMAKGVLVADLPHTASEAEVLAKAVGSAAA